MKKNINKINQSGRSMVEMLGVLAIIGVLSVGGIAGYTMAMNKHRANEILNAASVRAVVVSTKLQSNSGADITNALAEFGNETIAGASFTAVSASGKTFTLTLSGVSSEACAQIKNIVGENGNVNINEECTTFTYNADLSAPVQMGASWDANGDGPEGNDSSTCSGTKLGVDCQVCLNGEYIDSDALCKTPGSTCVDGTCTSPTTTCINETCDTRKYECSETYDYCESDSDCVQQELVGGICVAKVAETETACAKNSDCASGEFCNYHGGINCETGPNGKVGKCKSIDTDEHNGETSSYYVLYADADGISGILSKNYLDWFSAKNFCLANHKQMVSLSDSHITSRKDCEKTSCTFDDGYGWDDSTGITGIRKGKLASAYWWTKDLYDGARFCSAFAVVTGRSYVTKYHRGNYDVGSALCK